MNKLLLIVLVCACPLQADFEAALRAFNASDYASALAQFTPEAEQGSARAQNALGFLYERGLGVPKDAGNAAKWYRKSAEQEYGPGEYNYGLFCWHGTGVPQSDTDAVKWLERAARHGVPLAEFDLGNVLYKEGRGDAKQALTWWRRAAGHNIPAAAYNVAYLYAERPDFAHDYGEAAKWYRMAAMQSYPLAQYALGLLYATGKGVKSDPVEARMWLELAARGGVKLARQEMDSREASLSREQLAAARKRASEWKGREVATAKEDAFVIKDDAFGRVPNAPMRVIGDPGPESSYLPRPAATGFFVNSVGKVITSLEIVKSCRQIAVRTQQGSKHAELAGEDRRLGLALVAIEGGGGEALAIASASGDEARAIEVGYQIVGHSALTQAALGNIRQDGEKKEFRAETPPNPPFAGGPVLDTAGRVVAVSLAGAGGPTLITAEDLLRFLKANNVPPQANATDRKDLSEVIAAAKRGLVLVECKADELPR